MSGLPAADRLIGLALIDGVDDGGYLRTDPLEVAERLGCDLERVGRVLTRLQGFEPTGVDVVARRVADLVGGVEMRELLSALALLELKGYVARDASGAFVRNPVDGSSGTKGETRW